MNITNITLWSETVGFPLLTTMTLVPMVAMVIVLLSPSSVMAWRVGVAGAVATLVLSIYLLIIFDANLPGIQLFEHVETLGLSYSVGIDGASVLFIPLVAILMLLTLLYTLGTPRAADRIHIACLLSFEAILIGAFSAMNAMQFWIWCALELVPTVLITMRASYGQNRRWAIALLLQYWIGGLLMALVGFFLLALGVMDAGDPFTFDWLVLKQNDNVLEYGNLIFFLLFFGFAIRMPLFPFHGWFPVFAEQGFVPSVAIFLVGLKLGIYAMIRFVLPIIPELAEQWSWFVLALGLIGIFYGALMAFMQIDLRRLVAFAVISHTCMLIIGVFDFNNQGLEASILLSISYGLATAGLLFSIGMIYRRAQTAFIPRLGGMFNVSFAIAFLFLICALSTMSMPGTPGYDGAHMLIEGTITRNGWLVSIAILIGNVLAAAFLLRAFQLVFFVASKRKQKSYASSSQARSQPSPRDERIIAIVICLLLVGIGFHTSPWFNIIDQGEKNISVLNSISHNTIDTDSINFNLKDTNNE